MSDNTNSSEMSLPEQHNHRQTPRVFTAIYWCMPCKWKHLRLCCQHATVVTEERWVRNKPGNEMLTPNKAAGWAWCSERRTSDHLVEHSDLYTALFSERSFCAYFTLTVNEGWNCRAAFYIILAVTNTDVHNCSNVWGRKIIFKVFERYLSCSTSFHLLDQKYIKSSNSVKY